RAFAGRPQPACRDTRLRALPRYMEGCRLLSEGDLFQMVPRSFGRAVDGLRARHSLRQFLRIDRARLRPADRHHVAGRLQLLPDRGAEPPSVAAVRGAENGADAGDT